VREADNLTTFMCRMSWKSGSLNLLEPSGPRRVCYGNPLPLYFYPEDKSLILRNVGTYQCTHTHTHTQHNTADDLSLQVVNISCNIFASWIGSRWCPRYIDTLRAGLTGDRIPVGSRFPVIVQIGPGAHPASCIMGTGSFPAYCGLVRGVDHSPLSMPSWLVIGCSSLHLLHIRPCNLPPSTVVQDAHCKFARILIK